MRAAGQGSASGSAVTVPVAKAGAVSRMISSSSTTAPGVERGQRRAQRARPGGDRRAGVVRIHQARRVEDVGHPVGRDHPRADLRPRLVPGAPARLDGGALGGPALGEDAEHAVRAIFAGAVRFEAVHALGQQDLARRVLRSQRGRRARDHRRVGAHRLAVPGAPAGAGWAAPTDGSSRASHSNREVIAAVYPKNAARDLHSIDANASAMMARWASRPAARRPPENGSCRRRPRAPGSAPSSTRFPARASIAPRATTIWRPERTWSCPTGIAGSERA